MKIICHYLGMFIICCVAILYLCVPIFGTLLVMSFVTNYLETKGWDGPEIIFPVLLAILVQSSILPLLMFKGYL